MGIRLSATKIKTIKDCPMRAFLKYVKRIRKVEQSDALRIGSNWHRVLEVASLKPGSVCPDCSNKSENVKDCPLCSGTGFVLDDITQVVSNQLSMDYGNIPASMDSGEWAVERIKLLYSFLAYDWLYSENKFDTVARELQFAMPIISPNSGRRLHDTVLEGMIDKLIKTGKHTYAIAEHKSTSSSVDPDSPYWKHLRLDTQSRLYLYAARRMLKDGTLEPYGLFDGTDIITGVFYDVFHKPGISPKKLTQADSKKFIETGEYCNGEFEIGGNAARCTINGAVAEVEPGKKEGTFAIKETPEMYGARLLQDMTERPEFYFARKELSFTDDLIDSFEREIFNVYTNMRLMSKNDSWYTCESQCEAKFKCDYCDICYNGLDVDVDELPNTLYKVD